MQQLVSIGAIHLPAHPGCHLPTMQLVMHLPGQRVMPRLCGPEAKVAPRAGAREAKLRQVSGYACLNPAVAGMKVAISSAIAIAALLRVLFVSGRTRMRATQKRTVRINASSETQWVNDQPAPSAAETGQAMNDKLKVTQDVAILQCLGEAVEFGVDEVEAKQMWEKLENQELVVGVLALTKAGKSTVINAMIGQELLPSAAEPATACLVEVVHDSEILDGKLYKDGCLVASGTRGCFDFIDKMNHERRMNMKTCPEPVCLTLKVYVNAFAGIGVGLKLLDTPGPNEAGAGLQTEMSLALKKTDVILYVIDYTKIGTDDEAAMFSKLSKSVGPLLESVESGVQRIFYILNKIDNYSKRNDPEISVTRENVAARISKATGQTVSSSQVLPISAKLAVLARHLPNRTGDSEFVFDFLREAMGECFEDEVDEQDYIKEAMKKTEGMERRSNFADFEQKVLINVWQNKAKIIQHSVIDMIILRLDQLVNDTLLEHAAAHKQASEVVSALRMMHRTKQIVQEQLVPLRRCGREIRAELREEAKRFIIDMQADVDFMLEELFRSQHDEQSPLWKLFVAPIESLFRLVSGQIGTLSASDEEELQTRLQDINRNIARMVIKKWECYNQRLLETMRRRTTEVQRRLKELADPVLQEVVAAGEDGMDIKLHFEEVQLDPPISQNAFERQVAEAMKKMTRETTATERGGFCNMDERTVVVGYRMSPDDLRAHWQSTVRERAVMSQRSAHLLIKESLGAEVDRVIAEVLRRADAFIRILENQFDDILCGQDTSQQRSQSCKKRLEGLEEFRTKVSKLKDE